MATTLIRLPEVIRRTGLSRSTIYHHMANDEFPRSVKLGKGKRTRSIAWNAADIEEWICERIESAL